MANGQDNTVTIKLTKGRVFDEIIGRQSQEQSGGVVDFEQQIGGPQEGFQRGFGSQDPLDPSARFKGTGSEGGGPQFVSGFGVQDESNEIPTDARVVSARAEIDRATKEAEKELDRLNKVGSNEIGRIAATQRISIKESRALLNDQISKVQNIVNESRNRRQEFDRIHAPQTRRVLQDITGKKRFVDTRKEVFPGVEKPEKGLTASEKLAERKFQEGAAKRKQEFKNLTLRGKILQRDIDKINDPKSKDPTREEALKSLATIADKKATLIKRGKASLEDQFLLKDVADIQEGVDEAINAYDALEDFFRPFAGTSAPEQTPEEETLDVETPGPGKTNQQLLEEIFGK